MMIFFSIVKHREKMAKREIEKLDHVAREAEAIARTKEAESHKVTQEFYRQKYNDERNDRDKKPNGDGQGESSQV
jgi:hypothetical protein